MLKRKRRLPYPPGSEARRRIIALFIRWDGLTYKEAVKRVSARNQRARNTPRPGEKCGAKTRKGTPCQCKALANGRCKFHGGLSTGAKSAEGRLKVYGHE